MILHHRIHVQLARRVPSLCTKLNLWLRAENRNSFWIASRSTTAQAEQYARVRRGQDGGFGAGPQPEVPRRPTPPGTLMPARFKDQAR